MLLNAPFAAHYRLSSVLYRYVISYIANGINEMYAIFTPGVIQSLAILKVNGNNLKLIINRFQFQRRGEAAETD